MTPLVASGPRSLERKTSIGLEKAQRVGLEQKQPSRLKKEESGITLQARNVRLLLRTETPGHQIVHETIMSQNQGLHLIAGQRR